MGVKKPTEKDVEMFINSINEDIKRKAIEALCYCGEQAVKYAREKHIGDYTDHTSNLRSSIGFVVSCDGEIVNESSFEQLPAKEIQDEGVKLNGGSTGRELAHEVSSKNFESIVLVVVAGMNYATYVERLENFDVLSGSRLHAEKIAKQLLESLNNGK